MSTQTIASRFCRLAKQAILVVSGSTALISTSAADLVAHYRFDETSGTVLTDSSGNRFDGAITGAGTLDVAGNVLSAYQPGGDGGYGVVADGVGNFGITGNSSRTISLWFNTNSFGETTSFQNRLIGIGTGAAASFDIVAENGGNAGGVNRVGIRYGNGNVYFDADNDDSAFLIDTWYHFVIVYDGTTLDLEAIGTPSDGVGLVAYVNGIEIDSAGGNLLNAGQALDTSGGDFFIGSAPNVSHDLYPGLLDDLQVYDSALTSAQISTLFASPGSVIPEPSSFVLIGLGGLLLIRRRR